MAPPPSIALPRSAEALLRQVSGRVRLACLVRLALAAWLCLTVAWLALYLGDRCGDTPVWLRLCLFESALLACLVTGVFGLRRLRRTRDAAASARQVLAASPRLGHLLLSAVELAADGSRDPASRPLVDAALRQVAAACVGISAAQSVSLRPGRPLLSALALSLAALLPAILSTPGALPNVLMRLLCPLAPIPRITQVRLQPLPRPKLIGLDSMRVVPETPPRLRWCGDSPPGIVLPTALLTVAVEAEDDTGLERLELHAGTASGRQLTGRADCAAMPRRAGVTLTVCPADLGLAAGQNLRFEAVAADGVAGREPVRLTLEVAVSAAAPWIEGLSARLRRCWRRLEHIAAAEQRQAEAEQLALAAPPSALELEALLSAGLAAAEADASQLSEECAEMDRLIAAALPCAELDLVVLAAWTAARNALAMIMEQSFPALLAELRPVDPTASPPASRLARALPRRRDLVQALRAILAADEHFRRGAWRTAALRLREAARAEQALAADLGHLPDAWAGQARTGLGSDPCTQLDTLAQRQDAVAADLSRLGALLHDLATRGAPGSYGLVAEALDATGLVADLERAAAQIRRNHRFFALSTADDAATRLAAWATALEAGAAAETGTTGSGQGAGPGGGSEVALRLQRALLAQEGLRERTRLVVPIADPPGLRQELAATLALRQTELALDLPALAQLCPAPLGRLLDQGAEAMRRAAEHLRGKRLDAAMEAQAAASEWLTACLRQSSDTPTTTSGAGATAPVGAGALGLGQTATRTGNEAPLAPTPAARVPGVAWTASNSPRSSTPVRAAALAEVPASYRLLWDQYRRRLQEPPRDP